MTCHICANRVHRSMQMHSRNMIGCKGVAIISEVRGTKISNVTFFLSFFLSFKYTVGPITCILSFFMFFFFPNDNFMIGLYTTNTFYHFYHRIR